MLVFEYAVRSLPGSAHGLLGLMQLYIFICFICGKSGRRSEALRVRNLLPEGQAMAVIIL